MPGKLLLIALAASTLLGGLPAGGVAHSHTGGDRPHEHHDSAGGGDSHGHAHGDHKHGDTKQQPTSESRNDLRDSVPHWHVTVWFWEFTFPELPVPDDGSVNREPPAVVRLVEEAAVPSADAGPRWLFSPESFVVPGIESVITDSVRPDCRSDVQRVHLCDAARRERTGVLLT